MAAGSTEAFFLEEGSHALYEKLCVGDYDGPCVGYTGGAYILSNTEFSEGLREALQSKFGAKWSHSGSHWVIDADEAPGSLIRLIETVELYAGSVKVLNKAYMPLDHPELVPIEITNRLCSFLKESIIKGREEYERRKSNGNRRNKR